MADKARHYSPGLGATVIEYPGATSQRKQAPQEPKASPLHKLDLLQHIPDCTFKRYVLDVAKMTQIPANTSLMTALGIVSSVTTRCYVVTYDDSTMYQPTSLYVICEQDIGTGKSWVLSTYQYPVFATEKTLVDAYLMRQKAAEAAKQEFDELFPNFAYDTDATPEGLDETLGQTRGYFCLASAEQGLANSITGAGYKSDGKGGAGKTNKDLWLKGFNGEYHSSKRSKRDGYRGKVVGTVTSIAQYGVVDTILDNSDGTGAVERCWLISDPSNLSERMYGREHRHFPDIGNQGAYNRIMSELTAKAAECQPIEQLPGYRIAATDWDKIYALQNELKQHLRDGGKYSTAILKGITVKADIQVMKVAANLAIMDDCPPGLIPSQWVDAAIGMFRDYLESVYYLLIDKGLIGTNALEDSVIAYLSEKRTATRRQFQQAKAKTKPWSELPKAGQGQAMRDAIDGLIDKGIVGEFEEFDASGKKATTLKLIA